MLVVALTVLASVILASAVAILAARRMFPIAAVTDRPDSTALPPSPDGPLADALAGRSRDHPGLTGIAQLQNGTDAFAARFQLAEVAVSSLDVQYYIWRGDMTGYLLLDALYRAADRGVRVRLLLDDNGISGLDPALAALNAHPNAQVRLYNPFNLRRPKNLSFAFDFFRLNRRMHNKSFTVDGHVSILGGRNIGDEYFETGLNPLQIDLDVLAVGAVVPRISADFDRYWAARSVHDAGSILGPGNGSNPIADRLTILDGKTQAREYRKVMQSSDMVPRLVAGTLGLEWTTAVLVSDDPIKGEGAVPREDLLATRLMQAVGNIESRFDGITPYLVPGAAGVRAFGTLRKRGVTVNMLTNSLEATDIVPVHAGYTKRRAAMLRRGVSLFELRGKAEDRMHPDVLKRFGSSGSNLHAKTFAVDGARIFVGSFNFDPRSTMLNTEMGLLIESPRMATDLHRAFDLGLRGLAWRVHLRNGKPVWIDTATGSETTVEPGTTLKKRIALAVVGWLPLEWLL